MKSEEDLIQLLHKGDEKAFRIIFDEFYDELCLYAASYTKSFPVAEEIVEDVFVNIWLRASELMITTSVKSYLYRCVHNGCLKYLKKEGQLKSHSGDIENICGNNQHLSWSQSDPESDIILKELESKAEAIMESLPDQCKEIYFLNRYENLSYSEIAKKLKITVGTVKTQMSRAFHKFRSEFGEFFPKH